MSQHYFSTRFEGRPVTVVVGYDRPLRGFFCFIERNDSTDEDREEFVYSNLEDPKLVPTMGIAKTVKVFEKRLSDLGLTVPKSLFTESESDQRANVGNRCVWHEANESGART